MNSKDSDKEILVDSDENAVDEALDHESKESPTFDRSNNNLQVPDISQSFSSSRLSLAATSNNDVPYVSGNTGRSNADEDIFNRELFSSGETSDTGAGSEAWEVNYREAAIFLEEGKNNDKFLDKGEISKLFTQKQEEQVKVEKDRIGKPLKT